MQCHAMAMYSQPNEGHIQFASVRMMFIWSHAPSPSQEVVVHFSPDHESWRYSQVPITTNQCDTTSVRRIK